MILAAGRGERMRPLTDHCPKPLLKVQGQPLLAWHVRALAAGGFTDLMVNTAWLGEQIPAHFGERVSWPGLPEVQITYSHEGQDFGQALETAGGIVRALPRLADVFWVAAGDVYMPGFSFEQAAMERFAGSDALAHLYLVPNPPHNPRGDFGLSAQGLALNDAPQRHTYSTVGLYRHALFAGMPAGNPQGLKAPLAPLLRQAMDNGRITAERWDGPWTDVGTPERLAALNEEPALAPDPTRASTGAH